MSIDTISAGDSYTGLLIDAQAGTPSIGAALRFDQATGVLVEIPFLHRRDETQFAEVDAWFSQQSPPSNLILAIPGGQMLLCDLKWRGTSIRSGVSLGTIAPSETLLGKRDLSLETRLTMTEVRSTIDGLRPWTRFISVQTEPHTDEQNRTQSLTIEVQAGEGVAWLQGDATMKFVSEWGTEYPNGDPQAGITVLDTPVLLSSFPTSRPFADHLHEQRKVVNLLTLVAGTGIFFRRHRVGDPHIGSFATGGGTLRVHRAELISTQTVQDYAQRAPSKSDLDNLLVRLSDVGSEGMARWGSEWEKWKRFILPAAGVLGRQGAFAEDLITSLSMSFEAAGKIIGERDNERDTYGHNRPTTATYVYRCLSVLGVSWGQVAPNYVGLSRAIAKTYNSIKHYDGRDFPDSAVSFVVSHISEYVARLLALHIVDDSGHLLAPFRAEGAMWRVDRYVDVYGVSFDDHGNPVNQAAAGGVDGARSTAGTAVNI
jgi:hypothetical protein